MAEALSGPLSENGDNSSPFSDDDIVKLKAEAATILNNDTSSPAVGGRNIFSFKSSRTSSSTVRDANGWIFLKKTENVELWKKSTEGTAVNIIKGVLYFPGIPPNDVYQLIIDLELRQKWEKQIPIIEVLDTKPNYKIIYWLVKTPIGTDDRDFVQYMSYGQDEEGVMYVLYKNALHHSKPRQPGIVRAETLFSGTLIYPDRDDPGSTRLTLVVQDDLKGHVPKTIVNHFYTKAPVEWHSNITSYYHNVYKKLTTKK